jgi:hypothetical protein
MVEATKNEKAGTTRRAKQTAGVVLEVLAGTMTPTEAAESLGISTSRYYMIESKALDGLLAACRVGRKGKEKSAEKRIEELARDKERLEREVARYQALVRASQRTVGLAVKKAKDGKGKKKKRRRKPTSRALRYAGKLKKEIGDEQGKTGGGAEAGRGIGGIGACQEASAGNPGDDHGKQDGTTGLRRAGDGQKRVPQAQKRVPQGSGGGS